jgi:Holliday junction resolvase RusA-like endonuclease
MLEKYHFKLSIPKSVNSMWHSTSLGNGGKSRFYMDSDAADSKTSLEWEIKSQRNTNHCPNFKDTIVIMECCFVNLRKNRDTDNCFKILKDSFQNTGIVDNDKNMIERTMQRIFTDEKENYLLVDLYEANGAPTIEDFYRYFYWCKEEIQDKIELLK